MSTFKLDKDIVALVYSNHAWGNRKEADKNKIQTKMDKKMLKTTKRLVDSVEYKTIISFQNETKRWIVKRSVPSFFQDGVFLFRASAVREVEEYLNERKEELNELVDKFLKVYPKQVEAAIPLLDDQFKKSDYPTSIYLRNAFAIEHRWVTFGIPKTLPQDIYKTEQVKAEKLWAEAAQQITLSLRIAFKKLIEHAVERLSVSKGQSPKTFKDSMINNINEFIDTFKNKNITNDTELAELIDKAKKVLSGVDGNDLRYDTDIRIDVAKNFAQIEKKLDSMIINKPTRKFSIKRKTLKEDK